jgi:soluble lytic murein transglycosylase-like protein
MRARACADTTVVRWVLWISIGACGVFAQTPQAAAPDSVRAAMRAAAEKQRAAVLAAIKPALEEQRASVRKQALGSNAAPPGTSSGFFTIPWPQPVETGLASADCDPLPSAQVDALISDNATRQGVQPDLIRKVMQQESAFRPCAVSSKGAQGLMQLMPATVDQFGVADPFDPKQNVEAGVKLLKELLSRYKGNVPLALSAYNAGAGTVDKAGGIPPIAETQNYVLQILRGLGMN